MAGRFSGLSPSIFSQETGIYQLGCIVYLYAFNLVFCTLGSNQLLLMSKMLTNNRNRNNVPSSVCQGAAGVAVRSGDSRVCGAFG